MANLPTWIDFFFQDSNGEFPRTSISETALQEWAVSETSQQAMQYCNPLNCGNNYSPQRGYIPGTHIPIYPDMIFAADTYIQAFNRAPYLEIGAALRKGTSLYAIWYAIQNSPWCYDRKGPGGHCGGGKYPEPLYRLLNTPLGPPNHTVAKQTGKVPYTDAGVLPGSRDMRKHWDELWYQLDHVLPQQLRKGIRYRAILKDSIRPKPTVKR